MRESKIEKACKEWAEMSGWLTMKYTGERGYPDRLFLKGGVVVWIELKATDQEPTPLQLHRIKMLKKAGANAFWFDNITDVAMTLKSLGE